MHTTTFSEMFPVDVGGYIIDTPGIKGFGTFEMCIRDSPNTVTDTSAVIRTAIIRCTTTT